MNQYHLEVGVGNDRPNDLIGWRIKKETSSEVWAEGVARTEVEATLRAMRHIFDVEDQSFLVAVHSGKFEWIETYYRPIRRPIC